MKVPIVILLCVSFVHVVLLSASAEISSGQPNIIRISGQTVVDHKGDLGTTLRWKIPNDVLYAAMKRSYPNPYLLLREFLPQRATRHAVNARAEYDDATRSLLLTAEFLGGAVNREGRWEILLGKGTERIWTEGSRITFLQIQAVRSELIEAMDLQVLLPPKASSVDYDQQRGVLSYALPEKLTTGRCELRVLVQSKPRIMAATYKLYGNPNSFESSMWIAKTLFQNTGKCNIRNLTVSYRFGDYSEWSAPRTYSLVVPGGSVVDLYYPVISPTVVSLTSRTPVDIELKYSYEDEKKKIYSEIVQERVEILGVNQIEFSNLPPEERTGTWAGSFSNLPLLAAWVTHLDPPVKAFAGMVSQMAGGVPTSLDAQSAIRFARALYELEVANGVAYQTPSGFLLTYSAGQDIKYPRDVLRDKSGTCVDLAILFASTCEAVGLETVLALVPGHAFPVILLPDGQLLPVETTMLRGPQGAAPFEKAVRLGLDQMAQFQVGMYYTVHVRELHQQGVVSPELPPLDADILQKWEWKLPQFPTEPQSSPGREQ